MPRVIESIDTGTSIVTIRPAGRRVEIHIEQCTDTGWLDARAYPEPKAAREIARQLNDYADQFEPLATGVEHATH